MAQRHTPPPHDPETIAAVYLRHHREGDDDDFWAWEEAHLLLPEDPERAWDVLLALVMQADWEDLGYVGAGLLEDLCQEFGSQFIDRIEACAASDHKFKEALAHVWLFADEGPPDVVQRLVIASDWLIKPLDRHAAESDADERDSGLTSE